MKNLKKILILFSVVISISILSLSSVSHAQPFHIMAQLFDQPQGLPNATANQDNLKTIVNLIFGVLGATALIIISIAGFRFVIHQGEPSEMAKQRNSIIYAVAGLIIALSAWVIVTFVIGKL